MLSFEITGIELQICGWIDYFILTLVSTHYSKRFVDMIISKNFPTFENIFWPSLLILFLFYDFSLESLQIVEALKKGHQEVNLKVVIVLL